MSAPRTPAIPGPAAPGPGALAPPRRRLFRKYVLSFVGVVSLVLLASGLLDGWFSYRETRTTLALVQDSKAEAAAQRIEQFIAEIERQIGWTTHAQWAAGTVDQRRFDYVRLLRQVPAITELLQIDAAGKEQLKVSRLAMDVVGSGVELATDPRFVEARARRVWYGPVYFRKESEPYMTIAVAHGGRNGGVTAAEVNLKLIWDVVTSIRLGQRGYAYVVDREGRLIAHPDISLVLRNTDLAGAPQVIAARAGRDNRLGEVQAIVVPGFDGRSVFSAHASIAQLGWIVFVESPVQEALAPLYATMWRTAGLLLAGFVVAALGGILFARRMLVPVRVLTAGAARLGGGELTHRIEVRTGDELQGLAEGFNAMAGRLQQSYAGLEQKVEARTRELQELLEQQTATSDVLRVISSSPRSLEPVFEAMLESATRICEAQFGFVFRYRGGAFHVEASRNVPPAYAEHMRGDPEYLRDVHPDSAFGRMLATRQPVHVEDVQADHVYSGRVAIRVALVELGRARTFLAVPMIKEDALIGAFAIFRQEVRPFTAKQIELVSGFASQAVIAIENVRLFDEVQARTRELQESLEYQTATSDVLKAISRSTFDLSAVLDALTAAAMRLCRADFAGFARRDGAGFRLERGSHAGPMASLMEQAARIGFDTRRTLVGRTATEARAVQIVDSAGDPEYALRDKTRAAGVGTMLGVPLMRDGAVTGVFALGRNRVEAFTPQQVDLVSQFADQAVIAMENVRLFDEVQARTRELGRSVEELRALGEVGQTVNSTLDAEAVLNTIVTNAVELSGTEAGVIYVFSNRHQAFRMRASAGGSAALTEAVRKQKLGMDSPLGEAARLRRPIQVEDILEVPETPVVRLLVAAGYRALLIVPLVGPERVIGALVLRRRQAGAFPARTVDLMRTFAAQSVVAIQNARLFGEIQEKSRQLELASQHKSQFLANMSHELRTPLNAVLGYAELMADGVYGDLSEKAQAVLGRIQANGKHLLGLINDVLDLSKIEAGQFTLAIEPYSVGSIVQSVVAATESLASAKGIRLGADVAADLPAGRGDERRLTQVLLNVVGNAIKFTDTGEVVITAGRHGDMFEFAVRDTGPGIAPENQAKIFGEFQQVDDSSTRKKGGTGLGLAISRRIVEMHGGTIGVESELGKGSTFRVRVPMHTASGKEAAQ